MSRTAANVEDPAAIRNVFQRLVLAEAAVGLAFRTHRGAFRALDLAEDKDELAFRMPAAEVQAWGLARNEHLALKFEDRGLKFEAVVQFLQAGSRQGAEACITTLPRVLKRTDGHRLAEFVPDDPTPATFSNARSGLFDGAVRSFGREGLELALKDPSLRIQEIFRMGEASTIDVALQEDLRIRAQTTVAYFGDDYVGLKFEAKTEDREVMTRYQRWMEEQQKRQAQADGERARPGAARAGAAPALPLLKVWVDRDPLLLLLTEQEELAGRLAAALGRKFGLCSLDYIKGPLQPQLGPAGAEGPRSWGRVQMVLVHNRLRLTSPLELARQVAEKEACPAPVVLLGSDEDQDKKRNHALSYGAVDYLPVEPFKVLSFLRRIEELLRLSAGGP